MPTDISKAREKMQALGENLKAPIQQVLESAARTCANLCAQYSRPSGTDEGAHLAGQKAVTRDISKVYTTLGKAYDDIADPKMRKVFWYFVKSERYADAQDILDAFGNSYANIPFLSAYKGAFDGGAAHRAARDSFGQVQLSEPSMMVTDWEPVADYIREVSDRVGIGKGGWADVARQLTSTPALGDESEVTAGWITDKSSGSGSVTRGGTQDSPTVDIKSTVPYAGNILSASDKEQAQRISRDRMLENLQRSVDDVSQKVNSL